MTEMKWQEPPRPPSGPGSSKWRGVLSALRERPNEWALIAEGATHRMTATNIRRTVLTPDERADFEFTTRLREDGKFDAYARFIGEAATA